MARCSTPPERSSRSVDGLGTDAADFMKAPAQDLQRSLETQYGIVLESDKLITLSCPAELMDRVLETCSSQVDTRPGAREMAALRHLRCAFAEAGLGEDEALQRENELTKLLPAATRRKQWEAWGEAAKLGRWQPLGRPFSLIAGMGAAGFFVALTCWHLAKNHLQPILPESMDLNNLAAIVGALMTWWILGLMTLPARIGFPLGVHTVGDLARFVARLESDSFQETSVGDDPQQPTREEVAALVEEAVAAHLNEGENYHPGAPFPEKFGWGSGDPED